ncbi:polymeric immunoglobulin receptor [Lates calcarifer]|uniref:polymeric immunoglobulin receptor n=1 Tax=Lates calcarifer TaxID=8187 RepID=UPI000874DE4B|nr:polymeric immunoglobulin receptor [Lates calcarifer]
MNLHHVLFFCFFSALCGGNSGIKIYTGPEGGSGRIGCHLTLSGNRKFFCKNECKGEDVLIQTDDVRANRGRYSIEYKGESSGRGIVSVTIRNLTQSDSGRYRCGLGRSSVPESNSDFGVRVSDELLDRKSGFIQTDTEGENVTYSCIDAVNRSRIFFCKGECKKEEDILIETDKNRAQSGRYSIEYKEGSTFGLYVTITQVVKSDSGQYRCGYGRALSPDSSRTFSVIVVDEAQPLPNQTGPSSTSISAGSTSGTTQPPPSTSPGNNTTSTGYFMPLAVGMPSAFVLMAVSRVFYLCKMRWGSVLDTEGNTGNRNMQRAVSYILRIPRQAERDSNAISLFGIPNLMTPSAETTNQPAGTETKPTLLIQT